MESEKVIGFSRIVDLGNRCNLDFADVLEYLAAELLFLSLLILHLEV
ncbi:hypothetical protein M1N47_03275 [Dehalococcoidia bacterium]|nr:hypothetical protein [Dehalococcoidia bacterium]